MTALLADGVALSRLARDAGFEAKRVADLLGAVRDETEKPLDLVKRVDLGHGEIAVSVDLSHFLGEKVASTIRHVVPAHVKRRGVEMRLVLAGKEKDHNEQPSDLALIKAVVRAHRWFDDLVSGRARSLCDIAKAEAVSDRYVSHLIPLAFLAPEILAAILEGTQPVDFTAEALKRLDLPLSWTGQRLVLGIDRSLSIEAAENGTSLEPQRSRFLSAVD